MGKTDSPMKWEVVITMKDPLDRTGISARMRLIRMPENETMYEQDYPLTKGERVHTIVDSCPAPVDGWAVSNYQFRKFAVVKLDANEAEAAGTDTQIEEQGEPLEFSLGRINWDRKELRLSPELVGTSVGYTVSTDFTFSEGDGFRIDATGTVTPAYPAYETKLFGAKVRQSTPVGPSGLPYDPRSVQLARFVLIDPTQPAWAALLHKYSSQRGDVTWQPYRREESYGVSLATGELSLSINSVTHTRVAPRAQWTALRQADRRYWSRDPDGGAFQVKLFRGRFDFKHALSMDARSFILAPFWR
jgi:hypothetical protein